ncbi:MULTISPECIES: SPOR domain-containing protein [unclassified Sphingomonas]|uniref:SPOR domain-containing protein n=1 Tax=unclassified Sphingomonas TaxID=196159 RepID=UPI002269A98A|nr:MULTISPECIES: SPOR domain-containing protein [unclassified Sphingomonas]
MRFLIPVFLALAPAPLLAQAMVQPLPGTTDADRLAEQMRALAVNPRDVNALISAGELSLGLGDLSGAASLFARAEKVSPGNAGIKAGQGSILVRSERPGEALRYFAQAEAAGLAPSAFAADRGLAYDLIGEQERAQRDYRLALKAGPDAEITKRYALSLGISGKRDAALEQLDPLLRGSDRSAWRIRAFVLAMGGDTAGAEKIATTMLPPGMAGGLQPFFQRLPSLPATDRAFAVHFGEVHSTPERLADARLVPPLAALAPEPQPVLLAATTAVAPATGKKDRRGRARPGRTALAATTPAQTTPVQTAPTQSVATPPPVLAQVQPLPAPAAVRETRPAASASAPLMVQPLPPQMAATTTTTVTTTSPSTTTQARVPTPSPQVAMVASSQPTPAVTFSRPPAVAAVQPSAVPTRPAVVASQNGGIAGSSPSTAATVVPAPTVAANTPAAAPASVMASTPAALPPVATDTTPSPAEHAAAVRDTENLVLARIIAGLSIPASELGVGEPVRAAAPAPAPTDDAARVLAEAKAKEARDALAEKALAAKNAAAKRAADRKSVADKKALAAKKEADEEKAAAAKEEAEERKLARANPERIWVQVAGGAYEGDLPKAWASVKAKAPTAFAGRQGWTTPLRATNRVLAGPFKTDAEARAFVNQLTKAGVSSFSFTSDAGQPVKRLPAK